MKVVSFLGVNKYSPTRYVWDGKEKETEFFPEAVAHFTKPQKILICLTPTAREGERSTNWQELKKRFERDGVPFEPLPIPEGHSEPELWEIFNALTNAVQDGEEVAFDITNSFRSLPFLSFLAIAYLRIARNVNVAHVLYGAWDARDENNRSPVFDLTPFVQLLDWTTATNRFVETGDGRALTELLKLGIPSGAQMSKDLEMRTIGKNLKLAANTIQTISLALQVTRPMEVMASSAHLSDVLERTLPAISQTAKPFEVLASKINEQYGQFGLEQAGDRENARENLLRQLKMMQWYLEHEQIVQAVTLMREWIVSLLAFKFDAPMLDYENSRKLIEKALNNSVELKKQNPRKVEKSKYDDLFLKMPEHADITRIWDKIAHVRNDIAHVGMRVSAETAAQLEQKVKAFMPQLEPLSNVLISNPQSQI